MQIFPKIAFLMIALFTEISSTALLPEKSQCPQGLYAEDIIWYQSKNAISGVLIDGSVLRVYRSGPSVSSSIFTPSHEELESIKKLKPSVDPRELLTFILSKMPKKELSLFAEKIINILTAQLSDLSKISNAVMKPVQSLVKPIPLIPSTDFLSNFVIGFAIDRYQRESFAYLKAFHLMTKNYYITKDEIKMIKSREDFEKAKGLIGQNFDLYKFQDIGLTLAKHIDFFLRPLEKMVKKLENTVSPLLKPIEAIGRELRPFPLAPLIPGGAIYNRAIFICNIKQIEGHLDNIKLTLENSLRPISRNQNYYATFAELDNDPMSKKFMQILRKTVFPTTTLLDHLDEIFIDPIAKLPWGMKTLTCYLVSILSASSNILSLITKEFILTLAGVTIDSMGGLGVATAISKILSRVINEDFVIEFISETFYWSWIRYLNKRMDRMISLITQARADGVNLDGNVLKQEAAKIFLYS